MRLVWIAAMGLGLAGVGRAQIEVVRADGVLDPSRAVKVVRTVGSLHQPLPEEYVWTADDAAVATGEKQLSQLKSDTWKVEPHFFRRTFAVSAKPAVATLYVAGPRRARVWVNGAMVAEMQYAGGHHMGFGTMTAEVAGTLRVGTNVIAVEAVRGFGSHHHTNALKTSWLNSGEVLAVKLVAAEPHPGPPQRVKGAGWGSRSSARVGQPDAVLVVSDGSWKSAVGAKPGWEQPGFDDAKWKRAVSLGGIESSPDFFQWNADAGMYNWPGYMGEAPYMANYRLEAVKTERAAQGTVLDFGRELNGRLVVQGGSAKVRMGESMGELMNAPYLGEIALSAPAGGEARGPKTGFRYALVEGDAGVKALAEGIYYPAPQIGTFESNDVRVNKIFETAVYTAHLSMQDSILDGIKRDRGRWIGDDEVIDRVVLDVYGNVPLVKEGLEDAIGPEPVKEAVNGLPGYSAWWVVAEYEYVMRTGDLEQLRSVQTRLVELLGLMEKDLDSRKVYAGKGKPFVDWAKGFSGDSAEARRAVHYEYMRAFSDASQLLRLAGRKVESERYLNLALTMREASVKYLQDADEGVGDRWQTNAAAVLVPLPADHPWPSPFAIEDVLGRAVKGRKPTDVITPYYGNYMLEAMSTMFWYAHDGEAMALQWMKSYWGGMLDNGATSFWEAWDPAWTGTDPHAKLEADDKVGYNASLAHGWSSGPAAFLLEDVLGVKLTERTVEVHPKLAGLAWVKGSMATPLGALRVEASGDRILVVIPEGMKSGVVLPMGNWTMNGVKVVPMSTPGVLLFGNGETLVNEEHGGRFEFVKQ